MANGSKSTEAKCGTCRELVAVVALPGDSGGARIGFHRVSQMHGGVKVNTRCEGSWKFLTTALLSGGAL